MEAVPAAPLEGTDTDEIPGQRLTGKQLKLTLGVGLLTAWAPEISRQA